MFSADDLLADATPFGRKMDQSPVSGYSSAMARRSAIGGWP